MFILKKLFLLLFIFNLANMPIEEKNIFYAKIINYNNSIIDIMIDNKFNKDVTFELNHTQMLDVNILHINVAKNRFFPISIVAKCDSDIIYLNLNCVPDNFVFVVSKSNYPLDYYLTTYNSNCIIINNNINYVHFENFNSERYFEDISKFKINEILPKVSVHNNNKFAIEGKILLYLDEGVLNSLPYFINHYELILDYIIFDNAYVFNLNDRISYNIYTHEYYYSDEINSSFEYLPLNLKLKTLFACVIISINDKSFYINYNINFDSRFISNIPSNIFKEGDSQIDYEKNYNII